MKRLGEWSFRGYLPHYNAQSTIQLVTFRLVDSLPFAVCKKLEELANDSFDYRRKVEQHLDRGYGHGLLRDSRHALTVSEAFNHFHALRYVLHAWVVMPNQVHVLIEPLAGYTLGEIVQSWKSFTARRIAKIEPDFMNEHGHVWQADYFDRFIRDESHYTDAVAYIHANPVKAGLVLRAKDWRWSSAGDWGLG